MATSHCFSGFWRLTRLSPTTTAEGERDVHVAVIALDRHWRGAVLARGLQRDAGFEKDWPEILGTLIETGKEGEVR
jgi:hypothetical protein